MMEAIFLKILDMSLVSAYCIAIVLLIRLFLRKAPKSFSYILWIAVFIRLAVPFTPESPVSLVPQAVSDNSVTAWVSEKENTVFDPSYSAEAVVINPLQEANGDVVLKEPTNQEVNSLPATQDLPKEQLVTNDPVYSSNSVTEDGKPGPKSLSMTQIFSIVWLFGLVSLFSYNAVAYIILKNRLRLSTRREANIYESPSITSPFLFGLFKPKIYIPANLQDSERAHILRHEQIHIQRRDYVVKATLFAITCLHWFNPLVWLAFAFMSRDMEMSCDEKVIRELGYGIKKNYSFSLLSLASGRNLLHATPLTFSEGNLKGRVKNVLGYRKPALWIILVSSALVGFVVLGLIFNPLQNVQAANQTTKITDPQIESTTDSTAATTTTPTNTVEPSSNKPILDERYDNLFIEVDGERISYREVIEMQSEDFYLLYNRSPLDYKTTSPVDISDFMEVFAEAGYDIVMEDTAVAIHDGLAYLGYRARSLDDKENVTCMTFDSEEEANQTISRWTMNALYKDAILNPDINSQPMQILFTDSALICYDLDGSYAGDNMTIITYQSGSNIIHARITAEIPRLETFFEAMDQLGLPFPGAYKLNQAPSEWPENAVFGSSSDFVDTLTGRGYSVELYDPNFDWEWYEARSEDSGVYVCNGLEAVNFTPAREYIRLITSFESDYPDETEYPTVEYHSSDSYEMIITRSPDSYVVSVYFDMTGLETPYDGPFDRTIWYVKAFANLHDLSETEAAAAREEVDAVIKKLCFPE